jgi:hypothetical protein
VFSSSIRFRTPFFVSERLNPQQNGFLLRLSPKTCWHHSWLTGCGLKKTNPEPHDQTQKH